MNNTRPYKREKKVQQNGYRISSYARGLVRIDHAFDLHFATLCAGVLGMTLALDESVAD